MTGNIVKILGMRSDSIQGLQLFYAMYGITLVLGIQDISDALYKSFKTLFGGVHDLSYVALNTALFLGILLLAVRFFWSTGNIWQYKASLGAI